MWCKLLRVTVTAYCNTEKHRVRWQLDCLGVSLSPLSPLSPDSLPSLLSSVSLSLSAKDQYIKHKHSIRQICIQFSFPSLIHSEILGKLLDHSEAQCDHHYTYIARLRLNDIMYVPCLAVSRCSVNGYYYFYCYCLIMQNTYPLKICSKYSHPVYNCFRAYNSTTHRTTHRNDAMKNNLRLQRGR